MRLVVDASVFIGETLRRTGRELLADDRLELFVPEHTYGRVRHHLPRRIAKLAHDRHLEDADAAELVRDTFRAIDSNVILIDEAAYAALEAEATARVPRDRTDWPLVACALALDTAVWTNDHDLRGTGVATWRTDTLQAWLDRHPDG